MDQAKKNFLENRMIVSVYIKFNYREKKVIIFLSVVAMFFSFGGGPFGFGNQNQQLPRPNRQRNRNAQQQQGGLFGFPGILDQFMNPLFQPNQPPQEQAPPRPTFTRSQSKREKVNKTTEEKKPVYSENTGMFWKEKGNQSYKKGDFQSAFIEYSRAIELNDTESIFFSNRALCLKKLGKLQQALKDAQVAIELDTDNIKGHLVSGQTLAEIGKVNKDQRKVKNAIVRLTKALTLCSGQNKNDDFQQELSTYIYRAKKLLWYLQFEEIREKRIKAINNYKSALQKDSTLDEETVEKNVSQFIEASNDSIVFQIPDFLICHITLDLMEDPVVTDSGQVYQRTAIEQHIQRNGKTDPFTRKPISGNLYPCVAIKKAIEDFLEKNPWAYEFSENENYHDIGF